MVAHWPLDEDGRDVLGNHNGAPFGVNFGVEGATEDTGSAAEFDGTNSSVRVPFDEELNPASFTLSMWVNADSTAGFASPLTSRDDTGSSVHGYLIYNDNRGNWNFWTGTGGPSGAWDTLPGEAVEVGSWTHLAITYDETSRTKSLYVNGSLAASNSAPGLYSPNGPQAEDLHIGSGADSGGSFYFDGKIDDVALWNHVLTRQEVSDIMINGVPGGPPVIRSFSADPPILRSGQEVTLSWEVTDSSKVTLSPGIGEVSPGSGSIVVSPVQTTTYTLTAIGETLPSAISTITVGVDVEALPPVLNEFLASNETGLPDPRGNRSDWVEIHNPNPFAIDIGGWHLSDDPGNLEKFTFSSALIPAGGFAVFFASNEEGQINFQLSKNGEYLALSNPDGEIVTEFSPAFPPQFEDISYGFGQSEALGYLDPTPGAPNTLLRTEVGPIVSLLTKNPPQPAPGDDLVISAEITPRLGAVSEVTLIYRIGFGVERSTPMRAGPDGQFTATIPASLYGPGEMVRWYVLARTSSGESTREPPFPDPTESARYFGTVIEDLPGRINQPVMHWFVENPRAADTRGGTQASLYFEGEFYDNLFCRIRGQSTANWPKHKYKFDFYRGGHFRWRPDAVRVEEINVNSHFRDSYVRENAIFAFLNEAGSPAPETRYVWIKRNGDDMGLFSFVEQVDEEFLERRGIDPEGSMYKAINVPATLSPTVNSSLYRKVLRRNEPYTDLVELTSGINLSNPDRFDFVADVVNIPNYLNVMAAMCVPFNHDQLTKNYYMYHDFDRGEWFRFPWDADQGLPTGEKNIAENWASPLYGDARHTQELLGGNPNPTWQNHLHAAILDNPVTREMYLRRIRTLMDRYLAIPEPGPPEFLLPEGSVARFFVPEDPSLEEVWYLPEFDDSAWEEGRSGIGFENNPGEYAALIETRVKPSEAVTGATSIYQRYLFQVGNPSEISNLSLGLRYDDGFVAYLNGVEVARDNLSGHPGYNAIASSHPDSQAVRFVTFPLSTTSLVAGANTLAIQIVNQSAGNSDLLCEPVVFEQEGIHGSYFDELLEGFRNDIQNDVTIDQGLWLRQGITNFNAGFSAILNISLVNRRRALFETYGPAGTGLIPISQTPGLKINFGRIKANPASGNQDEEFIELTNPNDEAVDLSGWAVSGGVELVLSPGTVVPSKGSLFLSPSVRDFRLRRESPSGGEGHFVVGNYDGHLSNFSEFLVLSNAAGLPISETFTPEQPSNAQRFLVISEIMYHPGDGTGEEFIELMNISGDVTLDLGGITFTDGIRYTIPPGTFLGPGERLVIPASSFLGGTALSNGGETIKLEDAENGTITEFRYDDEGLWPVISDGRGRSLVLINPTSRPDPSEPLHWRPSLDNGGNPGTSDTSRFEGNPQGDQNGNGIADLLDYALFSANSLVFQNGVVSIRRNLVADDVRLIVEVSSDLVTWKDAVSLVSRQTRAHPGDGLEFQEFTLDSFPGDRPHFLRVRAQLVGP